MFNAHLALICDQFADNLVWYHLIHTHPEAHLAFDQEMLKNTEAMLGIHPVNMQLFDDADQLRSRLLDKYAPKLRKFIRREVRILTRIIVTPLSWFN